MQQRTPELSKFLLSLQLGIRTQSEQDNAALGVVGLITDALQTPGTAAVPKAQQLPVCASLPGILDGLSDASTLASSGKHSSAAIHAQAMKAIFTSLSWWARPDAHDVGEPFASGHANATVIGPGGLEERDDVWVGISLLAPGITYPDHQHAPEEVYLVLSPGHWRQGKGDWHEPGIGGIVHNAPYVWHAMRSGSNHLLATWCLWVG